MYLRVTTPEDAPTIATIYNQGIEDRIAAFETRSRTSREIEQWFDGARPFGTDSVSLRESIKKRGVQTMMPSDMMLWVQQQSYREMQQQAEQTRLLRATKRVSDGNARTFHLKWWAGRVLLSSGCALQQAGRATQLTEKGCSACLQ